MTTDTLQVARDVFLEAASVSVPLELAREISLERVRQGMPVAWIGLSRAHSLVLHVWHAEAVDDGKALDRQARRQLCWRHYVNGTLVHRRKQGRCEPFTWTSTTLIKHVSEALAMLDPDRVRAIVTGLDLPPTGSRTDAAALRASLSLRVRRAADRPAG